jgi:nickel-dependent lactate racemase
MTNVVLKYGSTSIPCHLPGARMLQMEKIETSRPPHQLVTEALNNPIGTPRLQGIINAGEKVVIVTSDITRYSASEVYLPLVVDELNRCGIPDANISIVIALGIHRGQSAEEHRKILGPLYGRIAVYDHDCDDPEQLVDLGVTDGGIPVQINRRVTAADRVIVTGTIGFHYFAGFGGGRKGLVPGVARRETCMASHFAVFNPPETGGKHPSAVTGVLAGNPVHRNLLQAAQRVEPDFLLNTVLGPNKEIVAVFCGELEQAHLAGCELVRSLYSVPVAAAADLAIISCGGEPKDINFIQAQKALDYGCRAVKEGGTIIFLAACRDGFGYPTFFDWFRYQDLEEFEAALRANYQINGQTAHAVLTRSRRFRILLISEFSSEQTAAMGMEKSPDLQTALQQVIPSLPGNFSTVIIPDGGTILPIVTAPAAT